MKSCRVMVNLVIVISQVIVPPPVPVAGGWQKRRAGKGGGLPQIQPLYLQEVYHQNPPKEKAFCCDPPRAHPGGREKGQYPAMRLAAAAAKAYNFCTCNLGNSKTA